MKGISRNPISLVLLLSLYLVPLGLILFGLDRQNFPALALCYLLCFAFYLAIVQSKLILTNSGYLNGIFWSGRILCLFSFPELSDDVYRYYWDGSLTLIGINPFSITPQELITSVSSMELPNHLQTIYPHLNSPEYRTVYPWLSQGIFALVSLASFGKIELFAFLLKIIYLLSDWICWVSVKKIFSLMHIPEKNGLWYFLNPLVILEVNGNLHPEGMMMMFLSLAILSGINQQWIHSAGLLGLSFMSKVISLMTLPAFLLNLRLHQAIKFIVVIAGFITVYGLLLPQGKTALEGYRLYLNTFEFNSGIFIAVRRWCESNHYWELKVQQGILMNALFLMMVMSMMLIKYLRKSKPEFDFQLIWNIWFLYLLLHPTVHPWYLVPLLFIGLFQYPLTSVYWSFAVFLSYSFYDESFLDFFEIWRWIQYLLLLVLLILENTMLKSNGALQKNE